MLLRANRKGLCQPHFHARSTDRPWKRILLLAGIALIILQAPGLAAEPIKIGVSLGLTGRFMEMSDALHKGFQLWVRDVNQAGGILSRPVRLVVRDDHSDPERALRLYREMVTGDRVDFLFAPYSSLITEAVLPVAEKHGIPILIAGAAADRLWEKGYRNAVGIYTPASKFPLGFLELLVLHDIRNVAVFYADDSFSIDLAESTHKWAHRFGLKVLDFEKFKKGTPLLAPLALKAREKNAEALIVCGHMNEAVKMAKALESIDWRPKAFYASVGPALHKFYDRCGAAVEGVFGTSMWEPRANYPGAREFNRRFIETYSEPPGYHAGLAYAAGQVLDKAITESRSTDRAKVRAALFQMDTMTLIGRFGVDKYGKQRRQHTFIIQWQGGRKELVWPEQIKTAEPQF